jgi:hypothetical protein
MLIPKQIFASFLVIVLCCGAVNRANAFTVNKSFRKKFLRVTAYLTISTVFVISLWCVWILWPYFASSHY